jgi:hypothetical protein
MSLRVLDTTGAYNITRARLLRVRIMLLLRVTTDVHNTMDAHNMGARYYGCALLRVRIVL